MPTVTPGSPDEFVPFSSDFEHVRAHRALENAIENANTDWSVNTMSAVSGVFTQLGLGGQVPGTTSTAAPIKGIYRTAAVVGTAVGWVATNSIYVATFSVEAQVGNSIQPGDPVLVTSVAALPTNALQLGSGQCTATNTIVIGFFARAGGINTTTVSFHVFAIDAS